MAKYGTFKYGDGTKYGAALSASDSSVAYIKGQNTALDSNPCFVKGKATISSSKSVFLKAQEGISSSKPTFIKGKLSTSLSKDSYLKGVAGASSSKYCYSKGQNIISVSSICYINGGINVLDSQLAYVDGIGGALDNKSCFIKGKSILSDSKSCFIGCDTEIIDVVLVGSGNDGTRFTGSTGFVTDWIIAWMGYDPDPAYLHEHSFFRWADLNVKGTIIESYIKLNVSQIGNGTAELKIYGVKEANPNAPTSASEFDADPLTSVGVDWDGVWTPAGVWRQSPSLNSVLQELVDNFIVSAVMLQIKNDHGITGSEEDNVARTYDYDEAYGAKLHIKYTIIKRSSKSCYIKGVSRSSKPVYIKGQDISHM